MSTADLTKSCPKSLARYCLPYLQRADELDNAQQQTPAYFLRTYAAQLVLQHRNATDNEQKGFLLSILGALETFKAENPDIGQVDGRTVITRLALTLFSRADEQERAGQCTPQICKMFFTASILFESTKQFNENQMDAVANEKHKYARFIAARMTKALKEGTPYEAFKRDENQDAVVADPNNNNADLGIGAGDDTPPPGGGGGGAGAQTLLPPQYPTAPGPAPVSQQQPPQPQQQNQQPTTLGLSGVSIPGHAPDAAGHAAIQHQQHVDELSNMQVPHRPNTQPPPPPPQTIYDQPPQQKVVNNMPPPPPPPQQQQPQQQQYQQPQNQLPPPPTHQQQHQPPAPVQQQPQYQTAPPPPAPTTVPTPTYQQQPPQQHVAPQHAAAAAAAGGGGSGAGGRVEDLDAIMDAQKYSRQAISALQFSDVPTAKQMLLKALNALGGQ